MSRSLSGAALPAVFAGETDAAFLVLLTISHDGLDPAIRVVHDGADVTSRGQLYQAFPFDIALPGESDDEMPRVSLRIDNIDRRIVEALRAIEGAPTVNLEVVLGSDPDTVEAGPFVFALRNARYDALVVEGELAFEDILNEAYPGDAMTPNLFPGLF